MTIRFRDKVRLASRDRRCLQKITLRDPGEIDSFEALYNFLEWRRSNNDDRRAAPQHRPTLLSLLRPRCVRFPIDPRVPPE